jgi:DNA-binding transcriptional LysR family regulator
LNASLQNSACASNGIDTISEFHIWEFLRDLTMNRLELLRIFCAAAEAGSFKDTAARLSVSPQVVTRAIHALEEAQSEVLFHRNTRGVRITDFGVAFAAQARDCLDSCDALFPDHRPARDAAATGLVRITAPASIGRSRIMPIVTGWRKSIPTCVLI